MRNTTLFHGLGKRSFLLSNGCSLKINPTKARGVGGGGTETMYKLPPPPESKGMELQYICFHTKKIEAHTV